MTWTLRSWRSKPIAQQPRYADPAAVEAALARVRSLPPLVAPGEIDTLRAKLADAAAGKAFLLQGGDCAERFQDCALAPIEAKLKILLQMSLVLTWGARIPVIRVGRMAGQYAKPRSSDTEVVDGVEMPSYRGDHVNGNAPDLAARQPDPERLVSAYFHSAATLNYARALLDAGFADLHRILNCLFDVCAVVVLPFAQFFNACVQVCDVCGRRGWRWVVVLGGNSGRRRSHSGVRLRWRWWWWGVVVVVCCCVMWVARCGGCI